jgi:hypothetical protein
MKLAFLVEIRCRRALPTGAASAVLRDPDRTSGWKTLRIHDIIMGTADIPLI